MLKIYPIILLSLCLISLIFIPHYVASSSGFYASAQWLSSPPYVTPGEKLVELQVNLVYYGSGDITNVQIIPIESPPFIVNSNTQTYSLPLMIPNQQYTFTFIGNITPNIPLGIYNFYLQIIYSVNNTQQSQVIPVKIPITGYVEFYSTAQTNGIIFPGEQDVPINLIIYNTGDVTATNVTLFLNSTYPLQFITKTVNIPIIPAGSSTSIQILANIYSNATIGVYKIPLTALVYDQYHSINMSIVINSNQTVSGKILDSYITLPAGPNQLGVPISLQILYSGPVQVNSYSIYIYLPSGFTNISGGNVINLSGGALSPYTQFTVPFVINIHNASLGIYTIPVKIIWSVIEGDGSVIEVVQYSSFTIALMGQPNLEIFLTPSTLYAGNLNNLTLSILNAGSGPIYNVSLSISSTLPIIGNLPKISYLKQNQSVKIPLEIYVPSNYQGEAIQLTVNVNYLNSVYQQSSYQQEIGVYVSPNQGLSIPIIATLKPNIISSGVFTTAQLILNNTLNATIYNVSISISSPIFINSSSLNLPIFKSNSQFSIPIVIASQNPGSYSISLIITYYQNNILKQEQISIPIYVMQFTSPSIPILISFNTSTLVTGHVEYTRLMISNILNEPLYNITISLSTQGQLYINTTTIVIPELYPSQKIGIPVEIYTSSSGIISIDALLTYYQLGQQRQAQEIVNTLAVGSVQIIITGVSSVPPVAVRGSIVSITATIYNFGTGPANALTVTVFPPHGIQVIGQNTYYVGNLGSDTSSTFTFAFRILNNTKPGTYVIPVEYTYTNDIGQVLHTYSNITITVSNSSLNFSSFRSNSSSNTSHILIYTILTVIIILAIVLVVVFLRRRGVSK
ncbi:MAG: hypothetical protein QW214_08120 [Saccharolobus sp.]